MNATDLISVDERSFQTEADIDSRLLTDVLLGLELALEEQEIDLPHDKKAELICLLYEYFGNQKPVEQHIVRRFLRLVG